jgi:hypothetical protein
MLLVAIREKTECPHRVSVSLRLGFDSHRLHSFRPDRRPPDPHTPFGILRCPVMSSEHHRGEL